MGKAMKTCPHFVHLTFDPFGFKMCSFKLNFLEQFMHPIIIVIRSVEWSYQTTQSMVNNFDSTQFMFFHWLWLFGLGRIATIIIGTNHVLNELDVFIMCALKTYANIKFSRTSLTTISGFPIYLDYPILFISRD